MCIFISPVTDSQKQTKKQNKIHSKLWEQHNTSSDITHTYGNIWQ